MLFADSLGAQHTVGFLKPNKDNNCSVFFGPENLTDVWQPVDRGSLGRLLKQLIRDEKEQWLDQPVADTPAGQEPRMNWQVWEENFQWARNASS